MSRSFPWDSVATGIGADGFPEYDRSYDAQDLRDVFASYFNNGVVAGYFSELHVSHNLLGEDPPMSVTVSKGAAHVEGSAFFNDESTLLEIAPADGLDRIDSVVVRFDKSLAVRNTYLAVLKGTPSANPVRPSLTREDDIYEIGLADVHVPANATTVHNELIGQTVSDESRCGYSSPPVHVDSIIGSVGLKAYPIGSLYLSFFSTSPSALFGGSWEQITGRFLRAASDTNTGGVDNQTLTVAQMPSHSHKNSMDVTDVAGYGLTSATGFANRVIISYSDYNRRVTNYVGSGNSFSNMPAYQDIYVWKRIA